ncbi:mucin-19-like [Schistocerca americana]|uniref:mucin-19-like n=1 Tax=Schistocerca americana TaxID=7009 RepID=UPI001F4FF301|nr:mucin-19-like [Schistocerca americana]XP_046986777.1 mucin-19-like [Schistocerca americana]XP_046986778.1 mucin-19-like [Schistocerca americana]
MVVRVRGYPVGTPPRTRAPLDESCNGTIHWMTTFNVWHFPVWQYSRKCVKECPIYNSMLRDSKGEHKIVYEQQFFIPVCDEGGREQLIRTAPNGDSEQEEIHITNNGYVGPGGYVVDDRFAGPCETDGEEEYVWVEVSLEDDEEDGSVEADGAAEARGTARAGQGRPSGDAGGTAAGTSSRGYKSEGRGGGAGTAAARRPPEANRSPKVERRGSCMRIATHPPVANQFANATSSPDTALSQSNTSSPEELSEAKPIPLGPQPSTGNRPLAVVAPVNADYNLAVPHAGYHHCRHHRRCHRRNSAVGNGNLTTTDNSRGRTDVNATATRDNSQWIEIITIRAAKEEVVGNASGPSATVPGSTSGRSASGPSTTVPGSASGPSATVPGSTSGPSATVPGSASGRSATVPGSASGPSATVPGSASGPSATVPGSASGPSATVPGSASGPSATVPGSASGRNPTVPGSASGPRATVPGSASGPRATVPGSASDPSATVPGSASGPSATVPGSASGPSATIPRNTNVPHVTLAGNASGAGTNTVIRNANPTTVIRKANTTTVIRKASGTTAGNTSGQSAATSEDSIAEDSSAEDSSAEDSSAEDSSAEDSSAEDSSAEDSSAEDSSTEDSAEDSAEDSSAEDGAEDCSAKDSSAEDSITEDSSKEIILCPKCFNLETFNKYFYFIGPGTVTLRPGKRIIEADDTKESKCERGNMRGDNSKRSNVTPTNTSYKKGKVIYTSVIVSPKGESSRRESISRERNKRDNLCLEDRVAKRKKM